MLLKRAVCFTRVSNIAGVFGVLNQIKMELIMKMMEANPEYEGESPYQKRLVMVNTMFAIIFALNDIVTAEVRAHIAESSV